MDGKTRSRRLIAVASSAAVILGATAWLARGGDAKAPDKTDKMYYRGMLGPDSKKIKVEGDKTFIWAGGERSGPESEWYDFTGSPIAAAELQFGIGKDAIRAIDDPLFVAPDDPRLMERGRRRYRSGGGPKTSDDIKVIGVVVDGDARAYPTTLLNHHELVNDRVGGKPVTVGW
ncbi:MAG: DUF3179 domain-containing protein [Planctomycetes bacterium]|nr:DUF3179 domain-containing protein [Planctomycetota bacterium]